MPERSGPPSFVGMGFERAGAEWWFDRLLAHPDVEPPHDGVRAMHFFDRFCAEEMTADDVADYHRAFRHRDGAVTGEWTPRYLADPWTPRLLARAAPEAKVLVMVADPVECFRRALHDRLETIEEPHLRVMADAADRSRYATHLRRLHRHVRPERVLVLQYERCAADPAAELARTCAFLGVRPDAAGGLPDVEPPPLVPEDVVLWPDVRASLLAALQPEVEALATTVEHLDVGLWPDFAQSSTGPATAAA
jgi:hypothetical protein